MPATIGTPTAPLRRPEIFISACSADLRTVREEVKRAVDAIGCHGVYQENFPPDYGNVSDMLRRQIAACDAVIHIAGKCYGAEPRELPSGQARRSYTQLEYDLARELGKKLYVFLATDQFPYDPCADESDEKRALQQAHRQALLGDSHLREKVDTRERLAIRVRELRETLEALRHETVQVQRRMSRLTLALLATVALGAFAGWQFYQHAVTLAHQQADVKKKAEEAKAQSDKAGAQSQSAQQTSAQAQQTVERVEAKVDQMAESLALLEVLFAELRHDPVGLSSLATSEQTPDTDEAKKRTEAALTRLTQKKGLSREQLEQQIAEAAEQILQSSTSQPYAKSMAAYATRDYVEATKWADAAIAEVDGALEALKANPAEVTEVKVRAALQAKYQALLLSGDGYFAQKIYSEAANRYRNAVELVPREEHGAAWETASDKLASTLWRLEDYREVEPIFFALYDYRRQTYGATDLRTGGCLNAIGAVLGQNGRREEGIRYLREAVAFTETAWGRDSWQVATARTNLGLSLMELQRFDEAREELTEALRVERQVHGDTHVAVAFDINNLAGLDVRTGRIPEAITGFRQALEIFEKQLGPTAIELVMVLNNLAELLSGQDQFAEAEVLANRALTIAREKMKPDHPALARSLGNLARAVRQREPQQAEAYLKEALAIDEADTGPDSRAVAIDCEDLAGIYVDLQRWQEADAMFDRSEKISRRLGRNTDEFAVYLNNRAMSWMSRNEWARAEPLLLESIDVVEAIHGREHSGLLPQLSNLASVEEELGRPAQAVETLTRAVNIGRKSLGEDAAEVGRAWHKLGWTLYRQRRTAQALDPIRRALRIHEHHRGTVSVDAGHCLYALVEILNELQRWRESAAIAHEALAVAGAVRRETNRPPYYAEDLHLAAQQALASQGLNPRQIAEIIAQRDAAAPSVQPLSPQIDQWLASDPGVRGETIESGK